MAVKYMMATFLIEFFPCLGLNVNWRFSATFCKTEKGIAWENFPKKQVVKSPHERFILSLPRSHGNSPYCLPYNSYAVSLENLVLDQLIILWFTFFFILITCLLEIVAILWGEILFWSLLGVKGILVNWERHYDLFISNTTARNDS